MSWISTWYEIFNFTMQIEQRVEKSIGWPGDVCLLSPPTISESHANFCGRSFHVNYRGTRTETEKSFFRWENVIFTKRVLSRLTAPFTWAASLGWTSAVTCCNIYREYYVPVGKLSSFYIVIVRWFFSSITRIVFHMKLTKLIPPATLYFDDN